MRPRGDVFLRMLKRADLTAESVYIYHCLLPWYHCSYGRRTKRNKLVCPEEVETREPWLGKVSHVGEWCLSSYYWGSGAGADGERLPDVSLSFYKSSDLESPVLSVVGSAGRGRRGEWELGWDLWTAHFCLPSSPFAQENRGLYALGI